MASVRSENQLLGVVACGGYSTRMGSDKAHLAYNGQPQYLNAVKMLSQVCDRVVVSCRADQVSEFQNIDVISDAEEYSNIGPMGGLLTAFDKCPNYDIVLIGCDYPNLGSTELNTLTAAAHRSEPTAFFNLDTGFFEPLLAYYPHNSQQKIRRAYEESKTSLQQFLISINARKVFASDNNTLKSVDTIAEYYDLRQDIEKR